METKLALFYTHIEDWIKIKNWSLNMTSVIRNIVVMYVKTPYDLYNV